MVQSLLSGHVAELVYAYVSEAYLARVEGSSPSVPTLIAFTNKNSLIGKTGDGGTRKM